MSYIWYRVAKRPIGCLIFIGHFPQKSPIISGSFVKRDLQLKASYGSSPPCTKVGKPTFGDFSQWGFEILRLIQTYIELTGLCIHRIQSLLQGSFAKETYNFKEPTNQEEMFVSNVESRIPTGKSWQRDSTCDRKVGEPTFGDFCQGGFEIPHLIQTCIELTGFCAREKQVVFFIHTRFSKTKKSQCRIAPEFGSIFIFTHI